MAFLRWYYFCALLVGFELGLANGQYYRQVGSKKLPYQTFTVDQSGHANFSTVQSAVNAVPSNNKYWICIRVKAGTYREKVIIPYDKQYIILKGEGMRKTWIEWDDHDNVAQSPTFTSQADNFVAKSISFRNTYNNPENKNPRAPAPAAMISGDKSAFYRCGFYGLQDTLWDVQGRHYYNKCTVQGAIDFIFGAGQSMFENCSIAYFGEAIEPGLLGYITAQGRLGPYDSNGFVFKGCSVHGSGSTYLGRPWRAYSRVIFYNSNFSHVVNPTGWDAWSYIGSEQQLTYAEHDCFGSGAANASQRVGWSKKLSQADLNQFTSITYIDNEGWLNDRPF
ncbi:probable pectinesterase 29 [Corylus avellana]|uniref:probable pectinesterase 29 n=1 Tax=Corylus avellana TaxID=13451 RepID=UPI001E2008FB|nr:probable pectinesterase 29 [Corylus avellana]XP_059446790.1 probable pectinesterase 29 [Corylus avellana]